jgi:hypothetical protein
VLFDEEEFTAGTGKIKMGRVIAQSQNRERVEGALRKMTESGELQRKENGKNTHNYRKQNR